MKLNDLKFLVAIIGLTKKNWFPKNIVDICHDEQN
jgi:hypothetical protein